jgi:hypothetical protein
MDLKTLINVAPVKSLEALMVPVTLQDKKEPEGGSNVTLTNQA